MGRLILLAAAVLLATLLSGIFSAVNAQSNISCCLTKKGKLKNCELGPTTRKECRNNQTSITLPLAATTEALSEDVSGLEKKDEELASTDGEFTALMRKAMTIQAKCNTGERFLDLGLTVYDCHNNLEWEKKTAGNVDDRFTWSTCSGPVGPDKCPPDGTAFDYIAQLNTEPCFAGHCDWRLPEVNRDGGAAELETIVRLAAGCRPPSPDPCIDPIFGPTAAFYYWSSVSDAADPDYAWGVDFGGIPSFNAPFLAIFKDLSPRRVRGVRTGP